LPGDSGQGSALRDEKTSAGKNKQPGKELEQIEDNSDEAQQNRRMRALEGSKSKWSGQFNVLYNGSSINNPFAADAPNPGGQNPPPVVNLTGTFAIRRRLGAKTSFGFGGGFETETPLQGQQNSSISDPNADFAISGDKWGIHNRVDFMGNYCTANFETKYGYLYGLAIEDDILYKFPRTEFTLGLSIISDFNGFSDSVINGRDRTAAQDELDYYVDPFAEYGLTKHLNLRSVVGIPFEHDRNMDRWTFMPKRVYETFGLGISATDDLFFYLYMKFYPSPLASMTSAETTIGINAIINLF
jgi:hypothetical protein